MINPQGQKLIYPMDIISISAYFGKYSPFGKVTEHYGIDLTGKDAKGGDIIKNIGNGYPIYITSRPDPVGGNFVVAEYYNVCGVPSDKKVIAYYGHLYSISSYVAVFKNIKDTQNVAVSMPRGLMLGKEGQTGQVTGPHLHLGLYVVPKNYKFMSVNALRSYAVDPTEYLWVDKGQKLGNLGDKKKLIKLYNS